ncbi:outer membrane beta-barrel family protein [Arthrospiribacter ruber]|uniref:TonB-dependent receptor n=1 Tax=Arthrospiribacter ruber TaxID=2487934 RepID=A0A951J284_9BACT|nr:outer membrane beta-barrel family protein [Arthrospiribacter ruber]MBW3469338.1 TonB-dependent receptor [Arthrospiribacter ruber]
MKTSTQIFAAFFFFLLGMSNLTAKDISILTGKVTDEKGEALPYANVALFEAGTEKLLTGTVTDLDGKFTIETPRTGSVQMVISSIGFVTFKSEVFEIKAGMKKDFGPLQITEEASNLSEVTVRASRPEIIIEADKTTVNVEGTVMAEGNTALDVIARSPGIFVDQDNNINLNGRPGVTVMINDRPTYMSAADLANFLRSMPAENIKSIEIISSPTSRFDAEGGAGIVNIKLKKNNIDGVFGNVSAGGMYNGMYSPNTGLSLNVKKGKWTNTASFNYNQFNFQNELDITRNFQLEEGVSNFAQESPIKMYNESMFLQAGSDYDINDKHSVGMSIQASKYNGDNIGESLTRITNPGTEDLFFIQSDNESFTHNKRLFGNLHYVGLLDSLGTRLSADVDYTRMFQDSESLLTNSNWVNDQQSMSSMDFIQTLNDMDYSIFTAKVDFVKPLGKGRVFETGLKGSWVKSDNNLDLSKAVEEGPFVPDPNSNRFIYEENVLAAYASYKGSISEKVNFQAGLRAEHSDITGTSVTLDEINNQKYLDLFPSLFVSQKVSEHYQINYNANRRISRPNYRLLNPFVFYIDPLTTEQGNPHLRPQYAHNFEMNHVVKNAYQFTMGYSLTTDVFQQIFTQDEETRMTTTFTDNLDRAQNWNLRAIIPVEIRPWWNTSNMLQVTHSQWKSMIGDALLDVGQTNFTARTQHTFNLPHGFRAELMGMYVGPAQYGQATIKGFGWVDLGVTKPLMKEKLTLTINGTDLLRSQIINANVQFDNIDTQFRQYRNTQGVRVTLRYKFAQGESFRVSNRSGSTEERSRLD